MLLCAGAGGLHVRLADFGLARHRDAGAVQRTGTLDYLAPEVQPIDFFELLSYKLWLCTSPATKGRSPSTKERAMMCAPEALHM